jgi:CRISP-associated protein Cas1
LRNKKVPLIRIDWTGAVVVVSSFEGFAADQQRVAWHLVTRNDSADLAALAHRPPTDVASFRLLEASSAAAYFRAWQKIPIKWWNSARNPIPSEWRIFGSRSSRLQLDGNRNASHPVNTMLNYAYAVLQSQVQIQAVAEGYDPNLGIMHFDREYGPAFVFDLMERPNAPRSIEPSFRS